MKVLKIPRRGLEDTAAGSWSMQQDQINLKRCEHCESDLKIDTDEAGREIFFSTDSKLRCLGGGTLGGL